MKLQVEAYSGYKANERPARFVLNGRSYQVEEILDQWHSSGYGPESTYFKVRASDSNVYILRYLPAADEWRLEAFRRSAGESSEPAGT